MDTREWGRWWRLIGKPGLMIVLAREWDPIGFGAALPNDEYECVTGPLATLLRRDAPADVLAATLSEHRTEHLGLDPDPTTDRHAAEETIRWYRAAMSHGASGVIDAR